MDNKNVNHVCAHDGDSVSHLGGGVDGAVNALAPYNGGLVAGGAFIRALQYGGSSLDSGGLAWWDPSGQWRLIGGAQVSGVVLAALVNGTKLYVGGRFDSLGAGTLGQAASTSLAMFNGTEWSSLGPEGWPGSDVMALASSDDDLYVSGMYDGSVTGDGARVARWDGSSWIVLGEFDGAVRSVAVLGGRVYAGGDFKTVEGMEVMGLTRFSEGLWEPVGGGVRGGGVFALTAAENCVYCESESLSLSSFLSCQFSCAAALSIDFTLSWEPCRITYTTCALLFPPPPHISHSLLLLTQIRQPPTLLPRIQLAALST